MLSSLIVLSQGYAAKQLNVQSDKIENTIIEYTDDEFIVLALELKNGSNNKICFCVASKYEPKEDERGFYFVDRVLYGNIVIAGFRHNKICGLTDKEIEYIYEHIIPN